MGCIPIEILKELAENVKRGFDLPHIFLAGSQSPKYPGEPKDDSDIDFVAFPIDYNRRRKHYQRVNGRFSVKSKRPELNGRFMCVGVFDPKDPELKMKTIKGHSVDYWRKFNVRLA